MRNLFVHSLALAVGLMFTPDTLTLFGNSLGTVGWFLLLLTPVALIVHLATVHSFQILHAASGDHLVGFQSYLGGRSAAVIAMCGKLPFAVCASAALAVTAGFVFNEVYVYWFPNFAFAFLLLGATAILNLFSIRAAQAAQVIAVFAAGLGLVFLAGAGLHILPGETGASEIKVGFDFRYLAAGVVVLIGYDLGLYAHGNDRDGSGRSLAMVAAVIGGAVLLVLWGMAAMSVVPLERLEASTVPYMTAARKALGQPGRYIMGMVAILTVFSAINAMLHSVSLMVGQLANTYRDIKSPETPSKFRPATVMVLAGASASLMAMGFAGEPHLETWIRSSINLWLIYYIFVNISAIRAMRRDTISTPHGSVSATLLMKFFSIFGMAMAAIGIIMVETERIHFLMFSVIVVALMVVIVNLGALFLNR
jgi:L-asparagine transporter-like permease